jgi:hypothetical protein
MLLQLIALLRHLIEAGLEGGLAVLRRAQFNGGPAQRLTQSRFGRVGLGISRRAEQSDRERDHETERGVGMHG